MSLWPPAWQAELMGCSPASGETLLDRPSQPQVLLDKMSWRGELVFIVLSVESLGHTGLSIKGPPGGGVSVCVCVCACMVVITSVF